MAIRVDHEFHARLYAISGNALAAQLQKILEPFMAENRGYFHPERFEDAQVISHRDLLREARGANRHDGFLLRQDAGHFGEHLDRMS